MRTIALALLLALPLGASAQPVPPTPVPPAPAVPALKVPAQITSPANAIGKLAVETAAKSVKWIVLTPGLSIEPVNNGLTLYFTGASGSYDLIAYTAVGDVPSEPVRVTITIGTPPAPKPPAPPPPAPTPPPADPLQAKLSAAYLVASGTAQQKAEWAKDLAALYRAAAKLSNDPAVTSAATLKAKLSAAAGALIGDTALTEVRKAVAGELVALLPNADGDLTSDQRTATTALFVRLATLLDALAQ